MDNRVNARSGSRRSQVVQQKQKDVAVSEYAQMYIRLSFIFHAILQQSETRKTVSFRQDVTSLSSNFAAEEFYSCSSHTQSKNHGAMVTD